MENILDKIVYQKHLEVVAAKASVPLAALEKMPGFARECYRMRDFMLDPERSGIIAEFKRRSPSKELINGNVKVEEVVKKYELAGAAAVSVLTDPVFFGGSADDLIAARSVLNIPLLRKDFIIDSYQLWEAKAWGADIVLLIAAILGPEQIAELAKMAQQLDLNVLLEVHNEAELARSVCSSIDAVGVNNRNLGNFTVDVQTSFDLVSQIPESVLKISESALAATSTIAALREAGFNGFLIGETFMKTDDPGQAMARLVADLQNHLSQN